MNYLAILQGLPPFALKGLSWEDRERYYRALEALDQGFHQGFPLPEVRALLEALDRGNWLPLGDLLAEALIPQLDRFLALALLRYEEPLPLEEVAGRMGVDRGLLYQWVRRGRLVVFRKGRELLSHPWLFLGTREHPPVRPHPLPPGRPDWRERV